MLRIGGNSGGFTIDKSWRTAKTHRTWKGDRWAWVSPLGKRTVSSIDSHEIRAYNPNYDAHRRAYKRLRSSGVGIGVSVDEALRWMTSVFRRGRGATAHLVTSTVQMSTKALEDILKGIARTSNTYRVGTANPRPRRTGGYDPADFQTGATLPGTEALTKHGQYNPRPPDFRGAQAALAVGRDAEWDTQWALRDRIAEYIRFQPFPTPAYGGFSSRPIRVTADKNTATARRQERADRHAMYRRRYPAPVNPTIPVGPPQVDLLADFRRWISAAPAPAPAPAAAGPSDAPMFTAALKQKAETQGSSGKAKVARFEFDDSEFWG